MNSSTLESDRLDKLVEHEQYIDKRAQGLPEVRDWKRGQKETT